MPRGSSASAAVCSSLLLRCRVPPHVPPARRAPRPAGRQLARAHRPAGVPPRAAPPPDPDGRARGERRAPRRGGAGRRCPPARHDDRQAADPQPRHHALPRHLRLDGGLRRRAGADLHDARHAASRASASASSSSTPRRRPSSPSPTTTTSSTTSSTRRGARSRATRRSTRSSPARSTVGAPRSSVTASPPASRASTRSTLQRAALGRLRDGQPPRRPAHHRPSTRRVELAKAKGVRVYGLNPEEDGADQEAIAMRQVVERHGRSVLRDERPSRPSRASSGRSRRRRRRSSTRRPARSTPTTRPCRSPSPGSASSASSARAGGGRRDLSCRSRPWPVLLVLVVAALVGRVVEPRVALRAGRVARHALAPHPGWWCSSASPALRPAVPGEQVDTTAANLNVYFVVDTTSSIIAEDYGDERPAPRGRVAATSPAIAAGAARARATPS